MAAAVSTPALMSLEQYLHTTFKPDRDFVDGVIEERALGEQPHGILQAELAIWFSPFKHTCGIRISTEQRIRITPDRVRVCDFCLVRAGLPRENVTLTPPVLCIEILSPEDRLSRATDVLEDYRLLGVPQSWLLDPHKRVAYTYDTQRLRQFQGERLVVQGTGLYLDLSQLFSTLD